MSSSYIEKSEANINDPMIHEIDQEILEIDRYLHSSVIRKRLLGAITAISLAAIGAGIAIGIPESHQQSNVIEACERAYPNQYQYCEDQHNQTTTGEILAIGGIIGSYAAIMGSFIITVTQRSASRAKTGYEDDKRQYLASLSTINI